MYPTSLMPMPAYQTRLFFASYVTPYIPPPPSRITYSVTSPVSGFSFMMGFDPAVNQMWPLLSEIGVCGETSRLGAACPAGRIGLFFGAGMRYSFQVLVLGSNRPS